MHTFTRLARRFSRWEPAAVYCTNGQESTKMIARPEFHGTSKHVTTQRIECCAFPAFEHASRAKRIPRSSSFELRAVDRTRTTYDARAQRVNAAHARRTQRARRPYPRQPLIRKENSPVTLRRRLRRMFALPPFRRTRRTHGEPRARRNTTSLLVPVLEF